MATLLSCPKCSQAVYRNGFPVWVWLVAIFLFRLGPVAFAAGRKPSHCRHCGFTFVA